MPRYLKEYERIMEDLRKRHGAKSEEREAETTWPGGITVTVHGGVCSIHVAAIAHTAKVTVSRRNDEMKDGIGGIPTHVDQR